MSYAVDKDKAYCRWIDDEGDLADNEYLSESAIDPVPVPLTIDELKSVASQRADQLLSLAAIRIAPLQDAVDLKKPDADTELLTKWKQYRIDVSEIYSQKGFPSDITWPVEP